MIKKRDLKDKKGVSAIVATLIIVLLVIVSAGIIWVVIRNIVQGGAEQVEFGQKCLEVNINIQSVIEDSEGGYSVRLRRDSGGREIGGIKIVLLNETDSSSVQNGFEGLNQLTTKTETFSGPANANKLEYTSYFIDNSGNEQVCSQTGTYTIKKSSATGSEEPPEEPYCGDGDVDTGEECDDGNTEDGDGCSSECLIEEGCQDITIYCYRESDWYVSSKDAGDNKCEENQQDTHWCSKSEIQNNNPVAGSGDWGDIGPLTCGTRVLIYTPDEDGCGGGIKCSVPKSPVYESDCSWDEVCENYYCGAEGILCCPD